MLNVENLVKVKDLEREIKSMDAREIFPLYGSTVDMGGQVKLLCPYHNDKKIGSAVLFDDGFSCFSCNTHTNVIDLVKQYLGIEYHEAIRKIAEDVGLISVGEILDDDIRFNKELRRKYLGKETSMIKNKKMKKETRKKVKKLNKVTQEDREKYKIFYEIEKKADEKNNKATDHELDTVYRAFINSLPLDSSHVRELTLNRKMDFRKVYKEGYRSLRKGINVSNRVIDKIKEKGYTEKLLEKIPGFFQYRDKTGKWNWMHLNLSGIILPIKDINKRIVGLQVRVDNVDDAGTRYRWFSSSFATNRENMKYGTKAETRLDIIKPDKPVDTIFITEGKFKAEKISEKFGAYAISVQGITNWDGLIEEIKNINKERNTKCNVIIAFDSDCRYNKEVLRQMMRIGNEIRSIMNYRDTKDITYLFWEEKYKGIDDFINFGKGEKVYFVSYEKMYVRFSYLL